MRLGTLIRLRAAGEDCPEPEGTQREYRVDQIHEQVPLAAADAAGLIESLDPLALRMMPFRVVVIEPVGGVEEQDLSENDKQRSEHRNRLPAPEGHGLWLRRPLLDVKWELGLNFIYLLSWSQDHDR